MKKLLLLFCATSLVLTSCSNDGDDNATSAISEIPLVPIIPIVETVILPKTEKYTYPSHPEENSTTTFTYDGNKIVSLVNNGGHKTLFTYTGNLITKTEYYEQNVLLTTTVFTYENNKLKSYLETPSGNSSKRRKDYTYNANGTISTATFLISTDQVETLDSSSIFTLDASGNIVKVEFNDSINLFEYDTKNSPFKNILGYAQLLDSEAFDQEANTVNNFTKLIEKEGDVIVGTHTYENTYDTNNFLTKKVSNGETYEYTY
ncbi:hypothetical protein [Flavobacterium sp. AJR]|uniref:hypothetical protein n=1 Tax=Flavobacterium sp. AJR TaxID=1979369 RepID=UPI000A3D7262|nr:hypothetical protein [Flavobacterium sp. AJR]OUL60710.1 hypothetical protein B8T70_19125 [Flavobacterium sp. AJR]